MLQFTPYVLMMNTRARASIELEREEFAAAARKIEDGMERIRAFYEKIENPEAQASSPGAEFSRRMAGGGAREAAADEAGENAA